jgi:hypothetical protein
MANEATYEHVAYHERSLLYARIMDDVLNRLKSPEEREAVKALWMKNLAAEKQKRMESPGAISLVGQYQVVKNKQATWTVSLKDAILCDAKGHEMVWRNVFWNFEWETREAKRS